MGKTVYEKTSEGGICFKSERWSGDVRVLNYVYDLWMPLLGITAIGIYSVYCRLERQGAVKGKTLQDIANACRIGRDRLTKINAQLKEFGFIKTEKPDGWRRLAHWTTTITVLDPPSEVPPEAIKELAHPRGYEPLTPWLVKKLVAPEVPDKPPEVPDKTPKEVPTGTPKIASSILHPLSIHGANAPAPPAPPATPKPSKKKKPLTPAQATFEALAKVCQIDLTTMTAKQRGALNQSEKTLRQADAGPAELATFGTWWYAYDWRGKRGDPPRPHQVRETWGQFLIHDNGGHDARQSSNPRAPNYRPPLATRAV